MFVPAERGLQPEGLRPHAALLRQAFAHCARFPTAASRRSLGRVSVPVWLVVLSDQLRIVALVGRYPTNSLIRLRLIHRRKVLRSPAFSRRTYAVLANLSARYSPPLGRFRSLTHPFAARQHVLLHLLPLDLHVLGTPPAFNLSQDQTLHLKIKSSSDEWIQNGPNLLLDILVTRSLRQRH